MKFKIYFFFKFFFSILQGIPQGGKEGTHGQPWLPMPSSPVSTDWEADPSPNSNTFHRTRQWSEAQRTRPSPQLTGTKGEQLHLEIYIYYIYVYL